VTSMGDGPSLHHGRRAGNGPVEPFPCRPMVAVAHKPGRSGVLGEVVEAQFEAVAAPLVTIPGVSRIYGPTEATALLPELVTVVTRLGEQRLELVGLRDAFRTREGELVSGLIADAFVPDGDDPELRRLRLRMSGIVDQMAADVAWLDERDIVLRDIATGLLDFPALAAGHQVWLCWRLGEDRVEHWHTIDEGFAGRRPLAALTDGAARA
jgi:hypothetical protein